MEPQVSFQQYLLYEVLNSILVGIWDLDKPFTLFSVWKVFQITWRICQRRSKTTKNPGKETKTPSSKAERRNHRWKNPWKVLSKVFKNCHLHMETHFCQNRWRLGISGHLGYFDGYYQLYHGLWYRNLRSIKVNMHAIKEEIAHKFETKHVWNFNCSLFFNPSDICTLSIAEWSCIMSSKTTITI